MKDLVFVAFFIAIIAFVIVTCFSTERKVKEMQALAEEERKKFEEQMEKALAELQDKDVELDKED
jgi:uncharacterized membrane protein (DUF106 family)